MSTRQNTVAVIPARYYSTRLPAKPLIDLCGKPMIQRVCEQVARAKLIDRIIVATDDERIVSAVKQFNCEVMLTPSTIRSGSDRVAFLAKSLTGTDIVVNIQGDEPLIAPQMIDEAVTLLLEDSTAPVGTLVRKIESSEELLNPNIVKVVLGDNNRAIYFSRSPIPYLRDTISPNEWHAKHVYYKHIGLYVYRKSFLLKFVEWKESSLELAEKLEQMRIVEHGYRIRASVTEFDSIPVDTPEDVQRVKEFLKQNTSMELS